MEQISSFLGPWGGDYVGVYFGVKVSLLDAVGDCEGVSSPWLSSHLVASILFCLLAVHLSFAASSLLSR